MSSAHEILGRAVLVLRPGSADGDAGCAIEGTVHSRVPLSGGEADASRIRGSDGQAARFEGARLVASFTTGRTVPAGEHGGHFTLSLRVRLLAVPADGTVATLYASEGMQFAWLGTRERDGKAVLAFDLLTDHGDTPFAMEVSLDLIGSDRWHDIVLRLAGPRAALFVDGLVVDEEWPIGSLPGGAEKILCLAGGRESPMHPGGFDGLIDQVAVWDHGLTDGAIRDMCGGALDAAGRGWELPAGSRTGTMQYSRAPGGGFVGDCLPFFHDETYHFYYLFDRRHHGSKARLGAHQWAHASSNDLVAWDHHRIAIPITEQREGSICTGSVFHHEGTWYGFYATRMPDRSEHLSLAVSRDGIAFEKTSPNPFASPKPPYKFGPFRDPTVFRDPDSGLFHMLVTAELENPPVAGRGGCLAHLVSRDLRSWEQREPFLVTGYADQPECSELFSWRGWYYLVFSHFGYAHFRMSRSLFGPWSAPPVDVIDGPLARVMKSAPFGGDRRIGTFFVAEGNYAGFAVFRELVQNADGSLGSRWPQEMVPRAAAPLALTCTPLTTGIAGDARRISISAPQGVAAARLSSVPQDILVRFRVHPEAGSRSFGVGLQGDGGFDSALLLQFEPGRRKAGWRNAGTPSWRECETAALYGVEGLDRPFFVELLALGETLDVCIDGRRTLINRDEARRGDGFYLFCHDGAVLVDEITIRPIPSVP